MMDHQNRLSLPFQVIEQGDNRLFRRSVYTGERFIHKIDGAHPGRVPREKNPLLLSPGS